MQQHLDQQRDQRNVLKECTLPACCTVACGGPEGRRSQPLQVLLLAPQLVGYARIACLAAAVAAGPRHPALCAALSLLNFALDALDGHLARRWRQATAFGALLDVLIDNASRAVLWAGALDGPAGVAVPLLEMTVFACTHAGGGAAWKEGCFRDAPVWVRRVMAANFRTLPGAWAVAGLMGAPLWFWCRRHLPGTLLASAAVGAVMISGRLAAAAVELWVLQRYLGSMLQADAAALESQDKKQRRA